MANGHNFVAAVFAALEATGRNLNNPDARAALVAQLTLLGKFASIQEVAGKGHFLLTNASAEEVRRIANRVGAKLGPVSRLGLTPVFRV